MDNIPNAHLLYNYIPENELHNLEIMRTPEIHVYETNYKNKDIILIESNDKLLPVFGVIIEIFIVSENIIIVYKMWDTLSYSEFNKTGVEYWSVNKLE